MKALAWLVLIFLGGVHSVSAQSLLAQDEAARIPGFSLSHYFLRPTSVVHQVFVPTLDRVDGVEIGLKWNSVTQFSVSIREGSASGPVLASNRPPLNTLGEYGRVRVVFTNGIAVVPGTPYFLELRLDTLDDLVPFTNAVLTAQSYSQPVWRWVLVNGEARPHSQMDFAVGSFVPAMLPKDEPALYVEQSPPTALVPNLVITNQYQTNLEGAVLDFFVFAQCGIDGNQLGYGHVRPVFVEGVEVAVEKYVGPYSIFSTYRLEFTAAATPALAQELGRRVRQYYYEDSLPPYTNLFRVIFSNAVGRVESQLPFQFVEVNDVPEFQAWLTGSAVIYPGSNTVVYTRRARTPTSIYVRFTPAVDADGELLRFALTQAGEEVRFSTGNPIRTVRPGRHEFIAHATDGRTNVSQTLKFSTMPVAAGLRRLKQDVRAKVSDRRLRIQLVKRLSRAQVSMERRYSQRFYDRMQDFVQFSETSLGAYDERTLDWSHHVACMLYAGGWLLAR